MSCYQASFSKSSNQKICARRNHSACSITLDIDRRQQTSLGDFADCANSRDISRYDRGLLAAKHYQFATHFDEAQREEAPAFYAAPIDDITRQRTFNDKPPGDRVRTQTPAPEDLSHLASPKTYLIALTPRRRDKKTTRRQKNAQTQPAQLSETVFLTAPPLNKFGFAPFSTASMRTSTAATGSVKSPRSAFWQIDTNVSNCPCWTVCPF